MIPALEQGVLGMHVLTTALVQGVLGMHVLTTALEQGVLGMSEGGVRQIVVTRPELGYPTSDPAHAKVGPKPSTFSGQRALDFVLQNQELIDKTLLFNASRPSAIPQRYKQAATDDNLPCKA